MPFADELANAFHQWDRRLRGWDVYGYPVKLEPPLISLPHFLEPSRPAIDDGKEHTILSAAVEGVSAWFKPKKLQEDSLIEDETDDHDHPDHFVIPDESFRIFTVSAPVDYTGHLTTYRNLLQSLRYGQYPLSFEIVGSENSIVTQFGAWQSDADTLQQQICAHMPEAAVIEAEDAINHHAFSDKTLVVDFGLEHEVIRSLGKLTELKHDPLTAVVGAMEELRANEQCVFQILFTHTNQPWEQALRNAVISDDGSALFSDVPEFIPQVKEKTNSPLYACAVRVSVTAEGKQRRLELARAVGGGLAQYDASTANNLMPLDNENHDPYDHYRSVVDRTTFRSGMILSLDELVGFLHYPDAVVRSEKLDRLRKKSKAAPTIAQGNELFLGTNTHRGQTVDVSLAQEKRLRHMYLIGASGTGKSTMMLNMIIQDMQAGQGVAVLDPHGDLIDKLLPYVPDERLEDVIVFDPSDDEYPIGFNIIDAHSDLEKTLLASDLTAVFRRLSTSWGDQMNSVLANGIAAMLESTEGGTLPTLRRFLVEKNFRTEFLKTVQDPEIVFYWQREFPLLSGKPQAPVLTRLDTFLRPKPIRHMVAQKENKIDFANIMQGGKIFLAKLSQGAIGTENSYLMGAFLVAKLNQIAYSRQALPEHERNDFMLYIDEFHNFITPSMEPILSGTRKYKLGLIVAHQEMRQLEGKDQDVAASVLSNPDTRVCFRLGDNDARKLQSGFSHFEAQDLLSLGIGEAIARVERAEYDFNLATPPLPILDEAAAEVKADLIIKHSQQKYGMPRSEIERELYGTGDSAKVVDKNQEDKETKQTLPGRGGQTHKEIQSEIKRLGEQAGFKSTIEKRLKNGTGHIDVLLERDDLKIACEVAVHSNVEQEIKNISKCIDANFDLVIVLAEDTKFKSSLEKALCHTNRGMNKVNVINADEFSVILTQFENDKGPLMLGYRVTADYSSE